MGIYVRNLSFGDTDVIRVCWLSAGTITHSEFVNVTVVLRLAGKMHESIPGKSSHTVNVIEDI